MINDRDRRPPGGPPGCALLFYVAVVHCWEIFISVERDFLSVLSVYRRIFLSVFIVYSLLLGVSLLF